MSSIISGSSPTVTFSDGTTQATSAIVSGYVPYTNLPAGSVLQVVNATYATEVTTSSDTYSDTGLTASITPKYSTSKILCIVNMAGVAKDAGNTQTNSGFHLLRGSTKVIQFEYTATYTGTSTQNRVGSVSTSYLDSPATTSSTTYKVQFNSNGSAGTAAVQRGAGGSGTSATSTITLMEIAG